MTTVGHDERLHDGIRYPTDHLLAIADDVREAQQATQTLHEDGFADVVLFNGREAFQALEAAEQQENPLRRAWERLSQVLSDEAGARQAYLGALRQGHAVVLVYAPQREEVDQATDILKARGAHAVQYFGQWTITDLRN
jgi:uncharacterized protein YigA (DUF484 family)